LRGPSSVAALLLVAAPAINVAQGPRETSAIARGRYIVEDLVVCGQCHTPRTEDGELDPSRSLMGAPVFYRPSLPIAGWAVVAPRIAGLPPGTDQDFIRLMTTGIARTGAPPRAPMLRLHMTRADAEAVLAYLKSLKTTE
jgi:mono/diheme cytochrome c family protein